MSGVHYEAERTKKNIIRIGTISATMCKQGKLLAKVNIQGRETDWMPVSTIANTFVRIYLPVCVGEQVEVHSEFGNADKGIIHRSIFNSDCKEPDGANATKAIILFADGTEITYDIATHALKIDCTGAIELVGSDITFNAPVHITKSLTVAQTITDERGDLTNFSTTDGAARA
ncbi:MAG: phage baseplate assembly protein V [Sulfurovaceae bacterium]|nr:phage baseplate assembly protein V [Sulfurovaceae bacterium]